MLSEAETSMVGPNDHRSFDVQSMLKIINHPLKRPLALSRAQDDITRFRNVIWDYYAANKRPMPWRPPALEASADGHLDPYRIVVSEIMLQQTQVSRVMTKYAEWMAAFPDFETLARASAADVLQVWSGLGYNRRALNVHKLAHIVVRDFGGILPEQPIVLKSLPGIGAGTAGSIAAFAFNAPVVFIETNIRRVFIHHFSDLSGVPIPVSNAPVRSHRGSTTAPLQASHFPGASSTGTSLISDKSLLPIVEAALDHDNPREWYYALMDYGTYLAKTVPNPNRQSKHYTKQSKFEGSDRQVRGEILRQLLGGPKQAKELEKLDARVAGLLSILEKEGFITSQSGEYRLV